eukprot:277240-Chlamydomonas_euryale.AAC.10
MAWRNVKTTLLNKINALATRVCRIDLPVMWDDSQLQMLQYAVLVHKVLEQRREWEAIHARLLAEGVVPGGPWSAPGALT